MATRTIRVSRETHAHARRLADQRQTTLGHVVADAIDRLERTTIDQKERTAMLKAYNAAVARMRADPVAAADYDAEIAALDGTILDGLEDYPYEGVEELLARESNS